MSKELTDLDSKIESLIQARRELAEKSWEGIDPKEKKKLTEEVAELILEGSFGDGLEEDYAHDGVLILGASEMSMQEVQEYLEEYG